MSQIPTTTDPIPPVDYEEFKCFTCKKYLSVAPIFVYSDNQQIERDLCGRCGISPRDCTVIVPNQIFETLAKHLKFPCSVSNDCKKLLNWGEAKEHEKACDFREAVCPLCKESYQIAKTVTHFERKHSENQVHKRCRMSELPLKLLDVKPKLVCIAHIRVDKNLCIRVQPVNPPTVPHVFDVILRTKNNVMHIKNRPIESVDNYDELICHKFPMDSIMDVFMADITELTFEFRIMQKDANETITRNLVDELTKAVHCSICWEPSNNKIYQCVTGHSICENCKKYVAKCPLCKKEYIGTRNFALENVTSLLSII